ncbi:MAG: hypothetical protein KF774_15235 [Planctomyces sp.]|nr:hypothetical protein [Planctomyces sp.]
MTCSKCGSLLKIKEELAGTQGKCPKCKTPFVVPQVGEAEPAVPVGVSGETAEGGPATTTEAPLPPARSAAEAPEKPRPADRKPAPAAPPAAGSAGKTSEPPPAKSPAAAPPAATAESASAPPAKAAAAQGDDFDPVAFLMTEGAARPKPAPPPQPPRPEPPARRPWGSKPDAGDKLELSDEETEVPGRPETAVPPARGGRSAADMAGAMLSGAATTSSSARDLLARTAQEGRSRAGQMPAESREPRIDIKGELIEVGRQYGHYVVGVIVLCVGLFLMTSRMFNDPLPLPPLARVSGVLKLDGKPLSNVEIFMTPLGSREDPKLIPRDASALTGEDGAFDMLYMPAERIRGAVIGKNRVWVRPVNLEDFTKIPPQFQDRATSPLIKDVKESNPLMELNL